MKTTFEKYYLYDKDGVFNDKAIELEDEGFKLFGKLFVGEIIINDNLVSVHSYGWHDDEVLIKKFKKTVWWLKNHRISESGGHYYFDTDYDAKKKWKVSCNTD
ncbi:MAG: hypothetical protein ACE5D6_06840 [Candidatus Zixiibacteriota bacterium]